MKNKILEIALTTAAEHIAQALRAYSPSPMICKMTIRTIPAKTDTYDIEVFYRDIPDELINKTSARIYYASVPDRIVKVEPLTYREADEYDPQGKT